MRVSNITPSTPLVSCVITTHNRAHLLPRAMDSVLAQTYPRIELIVVDDGSADETPAVINAYTATHPGMKHVRHDTARGLPAARNAGLAVADGEFFAALDDDDYWFPERIARLVEAMRAEPELAFVYADYIRVKGDRRIEKRFPALVTYDSMLTLGCQVGNHVMAPSADLRVLGGFDESLPHSEDYDMWLRLLARKSSAKGVPEFLMAVDASDRVGRMSLRQRPRFCAHLAIYRKHKPAMTRQVRARRLYAIRKMLHPRPSLRRILWMTTGRQRWTEVRRWIKRALAAPFNRTAKS